MDIANHPLRAERGFYRLDANGKARGWGCPLSIPRLKPFEKGLENYGENSVARLIHAQVISDRQHESCQSCLIRITP